MDVLYYQKSLDFFGVKDKTADDNKDEAEDSSDSEESYYSGLDDEEESSDDNENTSEDVRDSLQAFALPIYNLHMYKIYNSSANVE